MSQGLAKAPLFRTVTELGSVLPPGVWALLRGLTLLATLALAFLAPYVVKLALVFGPREYFALMMLAFGLGTLPNLLLAGIVLGRLNQFVRHPVVRTLSGLLVLGFGLYGFVGLFRLSGLN